MATKQVEAAINEIAERHGDRFTAEHVVEAARDARSPLHKHFQWNDNLAAIEHRLDQARTLIRNVKIKVLVNETVIRSPKYVRDPAADRQQGYVGIATARSDEDLSREIAINEFIRASAALARARSVATFLGLGAETEALQTQIAALTARAREASTEAPAQ